MTKEQIAYIAGIVDGEGYIGIRFQKRPGKPNPNYRSILCVGNTNLILLKWLQNQIGGTIYEQRKRNPKSKNWKPCYLWNCPGIRLEHLLLVLKPYLLLKNRQADLVLKLIRHVEETKRGSLGQGKGRKVLTKKQWQYRQRLYLRIRSLNATGLGLLKTPSNPR